MHKVFFFLRLGIEANEIKKYKNLMCIRFFSGMHPYLGHSRVRGALVPIGFESLPHSGDGMLSAGMRRPGPEARLHDHQTKLQSLSLFIQSVMLTARELRG